MTLAAATRSDHVGVPEAEKFPKTDQGESDDKSRHIVQEGDKWVLYDSDGKKKLGEHDTKEDAEKQEAAIKANEAKEGRSRKQCVGCGCGKRRRDNFRDGAVSVHNFRFKRSDGQEMDRKRFSGYASVFWNPERADDTQYVLYEDKYEKVIERVMPSAFARALREINEGKTFAIATLNHDRNFLIGNTRNGTLKLSTDETGLRMEIDPPDTSYVRDMYALMDDEKGPYLSGASFHFEPVQQRFVEEENEDGTVTIFRELLDVNLRDASIVCEGAYAAAHAGTRAFGDLEDDVRREIERAREEKAKREWDDINVRLKIAELSI